ncbi:TonB-dependent receptor [Maribacter algarum]|uniref:TonB-dependent receptor n=1 Tax=Maribacter algarum (ex Zhang et al. 2020) TaxID=2578118 RepID=A0A5S3PTR1_9FLAO|nr:TonB-dependent receptor [Maribacter algarum]TMM58308.1 TonB-dependent receptor [Maribacter algarum]
MLNHQKSLLTALFFFFIFSFSFAQTLTQTVKGKIVDAETGAPLLGANVIVLNTNPARGAITDEDGYFRLEDIPVGRASFQFTYLGYEDFVISEILIGSAKEVELTINLTEALNQLDEVVLVAPTDNINPNNKLATVSARSFSVEETKRFPASVSDPGRMALSFAGVTNSDDTSNEIIIRGNAPNQLLWRIEGIEVPEPNHFSEEGYSPGNVSLISSNMLGKSDFFTGAFPATYGNALSGVFDINLRNGNNEKGEYAFQFGVLGTDLTAEGPFSKNYKGSYLINYRYSTIALLNQITDVTPGSTPTYQDVSMKLNLPLGEKTNLSIWGIGGISDEDEDPEVNGDFSSEEIFKSKTYMTGLTLTHFLKNNDKFEGRISYSGNASDFVFEEQNSVTGDTFGDSDILRNSALRVSLDYTKKINARTTLNTGAIGSFLNYNVLTTETENGQTRYIVREDGNGNMAQAYIQAKHRFNTDFSTTFGLHGTYFSVNKDIAIEPRLGFEWKVGTKHTLSAGLGIHSRRMPLNQYFIRIENNTPNTELDLMQATHYILGHDWRIIKNGHLKVEVYYQNLNKVAIVNDPSLTGSYLNGRFLDEALIDSGKGKNYGLELTFEKFFSRQYYFLATTSLYDTQYRAVDGNWYDSAYNYNYTFNLVGGKEFTVGKKQNNTLGLAAKTLFNGGKRATPINQEIFDQTGEIILDENLRNTIELDSYFRIDASIYYRLNKPKAAHRIALDIQNATNRLNVDNAFFNSNTGQLETSFQLELIPFLNYRLEF